MSNIFLDSLKPCDIVYVDEGNHNFRQQMIDKITPKRRKFTLINGQEFDMDGKHFLHESPFGKHYAYLRSRDYVESETEEYFREMNKKKVYVVWWFDLDGNGEIYGVFSTMEKAEEYYNTHNHHPYTEIEEYIIDKGDEK